LDIGKVDVFNDRNKGFGERSEVEKEESNKIGFSP